MVGLTENKLPQLKVGIFILKNHHYIKVLSIEEMNYSHQSKLNKTMNP